MEAPLPAQYIHCTQCGGELHPDEGQIFLTCPYCSAAVYVDKSRVVFHWFLAPTLDETQAQAALARWMAGSQTVKDLDRKAKVTGVTFEYFPIWLFKRRLSQQREEVLLEPAAASSISELRTLKLPAGDLRKYDPSIESQAHPPSVPLQAALSWLESRQIRPAEIGEQSLVHIPLYTFKYSFENKPYTALVEAGTGGVFANLYPAKAEAPFRLVGGLAALIFLCLATFPILGALADSSNGAWIGLGICSAVGLLAAPLLFALATWIAAKI